jgi:hypothetical protein
MYRDKKKRSAETGGSPSVVTEAQVQSTEALKFRAEWCPAEGFLSQPARCPTHGHMASLGYSENADFKRSTKMKTFEWIISKIHSKLGGLHPLGAPSVHPTDSQYLEAKMLISKAQR